MSKCVRMCWLFSKEKENCYSMSIDKAVQNYCVIMSAELLPFEEEGEDVEGVLLKELGIERTVLTKSIEDEFHNALQSIAKMRLQNTELDQLLQSWKPH